jgi:CheY-specific phosphatase CheX
VLGDLLGDVAVGDVGLSSLVVLGVLAILTGKLVPKSTLDTANKTAEKMTEAYMTQQQINQELAGSVGELLASQRASTHALQEIQAAGAYALAQRKAEEA